MGSPHYVPTWVKLVLTNTLLISFEKGHIEQQWFYTSSYWGLLEECTIYEAVKVKQGRIQSATSKAKSHANWQCNTTNNSQVEWFDVLKVLSKKQMCLLSKATHFLHSPPLIQLIYNLTITQIKFYIYIFKNVLCSISQR